MLTTEDIETLNAARKVLLQFQRLAEFNRRPKVDGWLEPDGFDYGKFHEAADGANTAIFNVLNIARSYCKVEITDDQIYMREEAEVDA